MYVYCLGDDLRAEWFEGVRGVGGARVRVLALGGVAAAVSEFEGGAAKPDAENVRAHNRVNATALARATPLPFRFGTLAGEQRLAEYVSENETALLAALARVRGCVEMSVKVGREQKAKGKRQKAEEEGEEAAGGRETAPGVDAFGDAVEGGGSAGAGRGTAFLMAKRREVLGDEALRQSAEEVAAWLASRVLGLVRESATRIRPSEAIVVRAAHLVERARLEAYKARVRELIAERAGLHFLTSGPWPPYSFGDIERR